MHSDVMCSLPIPQLRNHGDGRDIDKVQETHLPSSSFEACDCYGIMAAMKRIILITGGTSSSDAITVRSKQARTEE